MRIDPHLPRRALRGATDVNAEFHPWMLAQTASTLVRSGILGPGRPDRSLRRLDALRRWGPSLAGGFAQAAAHSPDRTAIVDERGTVTFAQLEERTTRLARAFLDQDVKPGDRVAVLCRNHRGFIETLVAAAKIGAHAVMLNTGLSSDQMARVVHEQQVNVVVADQEFDQVLSGVPSRVTRITAWKDQPVEGRTLEGLIRDTPTGKLRSPDKPGRIIVLTSGTTGTPKGANRPAPKSLSPLTSILSRIPLRAGEPTLIAAPMFHTWGFAGLQLSMALRSTIVLQRRFDPEASLAALAQHRCTTMFVVPVMLQRMLELPESVLSKYDTSALRIIASSGSALPAAVVTRVLDTFGEVLYNLYGSTEVSWVSIANPEDLRADARTAGRPPLGTQLAILDDKNKPVPTSTTGRIFCRNGMLFEGYTSGASKDIHDGMMSIGDLGHFDSAGLLYVDGREDDMIVSGGENVYPREVEELLAARPEVREVAVIGVEDEKFGQRLAAYIVLNPDQKLDEDQVKEHVKKHLARFSVPRDVIFLDELPRNATGKVVARELRQRTEGDSGTAVTVGPQ